MALDATVGSSTTNSYVTLAEAEAYFENRAYASAWESYEDQEQVLVTASMMLDWYVGFKGYRSSTTQSMQWPRTSAIRVDGTTIDSDVIPAEVKTAVYELALSSLDGDRTTDNDLAGLNKVQVSSLLVEADASSAESTPIPQKIWMILSDLTSSSGLSVIRLMRA